MGVSAAPPPELLDFPRLAQDATTDQIELVVEYLATLPLTELRQRQAIHDQQITWAYEQGKHDILLSEQIKRDMTTDAVSRVAFGLPMTGRHSDPHHSDRQEGRQ